MQGHKKPARNYLGKQKTVKNIPVKWKSGPDAPETELAYITKAEKDLLLKKNLHGSLKNGPNTGPDGIMSLDSQGDYTRDRSPAGRQSSPGGSDRSRISQDKHEAHMRSILTGQKDIGQTSRVSDRTRRGAVPEYVNTPAGMKYVGSAYKDTGKRGFLSRLFGGANKYGYAPVKGLKSIKTRGIPGQQGFEYFSEDEEVGDIKPGYGGRILGGLASLLTGVPFVGGFIGNQIDKYKPKSYFDKMDPSERRRLNALSLTPYNEQKISIQNDVPMDRLDPWSTPINNQIVPLAKPTNNVFNYKDQVQSMTDFSPKNFNVNQNYGTALNKPHFNYPMGANQNWIGNTMTNPNEATQGINLNNTSGIVPNYGAGNPRLPKRMADGGRIGYNRGRVVNPGGYAGEEDFEELEDENIYEFMQDQGVPYSEMAEGEDFLLREEYDKYLFEMEELDLVPMSFEDFKEQAMMAEGESDQGIASIV